MWGCCRRPCCCCCCCCRRCYCWAWNCERRQGEGCRHEGCRWAPGAHAGGWRAVVYTARRCCCRCERLAGMLLRHRRHTLAWPLLPQVLMGGGGGGAACLQTHTACCCCWPRRLDRDAGTMPQVRSRGEWPRRPSERVGGLQGHPCTCKGFASARMLFQWSGWDAGARQMRPCWPAEVPPLPAPAPAARPRACRCAYQGWCMTRSPCHRPSRTLLCACAAGHPSVLSRRGGREVPAYRAGWRRMG